MTSLGRTLRNVGLLLIGVCISLAIQLEPVKASTWNTGDVFTGVSGGSYQVYDNTGVLKETISDGLGGFTTGCAFNGALDKLYTTNFSNTKVVVYDNAHPHTILQTIDTGATSPGGQSESIVFDGAGNFYVGHPDGNRLLHKYDAAGTLITTFAPAVQNRGTDWNDLAADQCTMFYTSEGTIIKRFDVCTNTQLADFASGLPDSAFALRILPDGGVLVADLSAILRLDSTGTIVQTYDAPGENVWFALNLDPNGTSFWSANPSSANFYRFNIATGAIEVGPINTGTGGGTLFGVCVKGERTVARQVEVPVDIKPTSCPNPLNTGSQGVLPVAILGTATFDVTQVDVTTVKLEGVSPLRSALEDVATPFVPFKGKVDCLKDCTTAGPDGFLDLTLKFKTQAVVAALGPVADRACLALKLTGKLLNGTLIVGEDVVTILKKQ